MIAYMEACRELSNGARGQVSSYGAAHRHAGELVDDALRLVGQAEEVLRLAVAAERAASTSWQELGERLGVSRQSAHERFAQAVQAISDGALFPAREPAREGELGWWACPDGLEDPEATVGGWMSGRCVIASPRTRTAASTRSPQASGAARTWLPSRRSVWSPRWPGGSWTATSRLGSASARRDGCCSSARSRPLTWSPRASRRPRARDARAQASEAFQEFVAWHRDDLEPRLSVDSVTYAELEAYRFALDGRPVAELAFTAEGSDEDTGWFRWSIDAQAFEAEPDAPSRWLGDPWPVEVAGVDVDELVAIDRRDGRQAVLVAAADVVQLTRATALAAARSELLGSLASDLAKGVGPLIPVAAGPAGATEQPVLRAANRRSSGWRPGFRAVSRPSRRGTIRVER